MSTHWHRTGNQRRGRGQRTDPGASLAAGRGDRRRAAGSDSERGLTTGEATRLVAHISDFHEVRRREGRWSRRVALVPKAHAQESPVIHVSVGARFDESRP